MSSAARIFLRRGIASEECTHTKSKRFAFSSTCLLSSLNFPAPKMIRLAVANSKENIVFTPLFAWSPKSPDFEIPTTGVVGLHYLQIFVAGKDVCIFDSLSGFSHHRHDLITPALVMSCLFMNGRSLHCFIDFDQDKLRWVICLLDHLKARNPCFLHAIAGILNGCLLESFDEFRFDTYMNKDNLHSLLLIKSLWFQLLGLL